MFRILFVIIAAAVITFSTLILGHYLKKKVAEAEAAMNTSEPASEQITSRPKLSENSSSTRALFAGGLELRNYRTEDAVVSAVNSLAESYDTLLVDLTDATGSLLYTSPALCERLRMAVPTTNDELTLVRSAFSAAKSKELYVCVVMDTSFGLLERGQDELADGTLFAELASFGVDEILIKNAVIDEEDIPAEELAAYLDGCAELMQGGCQLGILFPDEVFLNFSNAHAIQTISHAADFTGIDMTSYSSTTPEAMYEKMTEDVSSLYGSFSIYNMRVVLSTVDMELLAAQVQALRDSDIYNICFTESISPDILNYNGTGTPVSEPETEAKPETTVPVVPQKNPYATVGDDSTNEDDTVDADDDNGTSDETALDNEDEFYDGSYVDENGNVVRPWY